MPGPAPRGGAGKLGTALRFFVSVHTDKVPAALCTGPGGASVVIVFPLMAQSQDQHHLGGLDLV